MRLSTKDADDQEGTQRIMSPEHFQFILTVALANQRAMTDTQRLVLYYQCWRQLAQRWPLDGCGCAHWPLVVAAGRN